MPALIHDLTEGVVDDPSASLVNVDVDAEFLRACRRPHHSWCRCPHGEGAMFVLIEIDRPGRGLVQQSLRKLIVQRLQRRGNDLAVAAGAIASAVAAVVLEMRNARELAEIEVRISAARAVDATHRALGLKRTDEFKRRFTADDLGETLNFIEWDGEIDTLNLLEEKKKMIQGARIK